MIVFDWMLKRGLNLSILLTFQCASDKRMTVARSSMIDSSFYSHDNLTHHLVGTICCSSVINLERIFFPSKEILVELALLLLL